MYEPKTDAIVLLGGPGSGKGTQGELLGKYRSLFYHVSTGNLLRELKKKGIETPNTLTSLEKQVYQILGNVDRGAFVPDKLMVAYLDQCLEQKCDLGEFRPLRQTLVLDGIPRRREQVNLIENLIDGVWKVIELDEEDSTLAMRLRLRGIESGRADDTDIDVIKKRLKTYHEETRGVLCEYEPSIITTIDVRGKSKMEVHEKIRSALGLTASNMPIPNDVLELIKEEENRFIPSIRQRNN